MNTLFEDMVAAPSTILRAEKDYLSNRVTCHRCEGKRYVIRETYLYANGSSGVPKLTLKKCNRDYKERRPFDPFLPKDQQFPELPKTIVCDAAICPRCSGAGTILPEVKREDEDGRKVKREKKTRGPR